MNILAYLILPLQALTPGAASNDSLTTICHSGYSKTVRHTSGKLKHQIYAEYNILSHASGEYEIDHLIPLELGGADVKENLWPQPYHGEWNAHMKDRLENYLKFLVCTNRESLLTAQNEIKTDWIASYMNRIGVGN